MSFTVNALNGNSNSNSKSNSNGNNSNSNSYNSNVPTMILKITIVFSGL